MNKQTNPLYIIFFICHWSVLTSNSNNVFLTGAPPPPRLLGLLSVLRRLYCCCWFVWMLLQFGDSVIVLCFVVYYFMSTLVLQSSWWGRDLVALLSLSWLCLVIVVWRFLAVSRVCLQFVIVAYPDHTHLLFWRSFLIALSVLFT